MSYLNKESQQRNRHYEKEPNGYSRAEKYNKLK